MTIRLYSSFPSGAAGIGLLLLRILSGGGFAEQSRQALFSLLTEPASKNGTLREVAAAFVLLAGILIIIGLWTAVAASVAPTAALVSAGLGFVPSDSLLFAALSVAIVLLGPGALSLDARLFGWRQIRFPRGGTRESRER